MQLRRLTLPVVLMVTMASALPAQADPVLKASFVALIAAHTADISTTAYCLGARTCREQNPVLRWAEKRPLALGLTKGAIAGGLCLIGYAIARKGHPKAALVFNLVQAAAITAVAVRNTHNVQH